MPAAETISITMTPEQLRAVRDSVASGEYASTSDVLPTHCASGSASVRSTLNAIRARRSLDDPRPDLTGDEVQASLDALFAEAEAEAEKAAKQEAKRA